MKTCWKIENYIVYMGLGIQVDYSEGSHNQFQGLAYK